jgi:hypothetical protein
MAESFAKIFLDAHYSSARHHNLVIGRLHQARRGGESISYDFKDDFTYAHPDKPQAVFDRKYIRSPPQDLALLFVSPFCTFILLRAES